MRLKRTTLLELKKILKEEYCLNLSNRDLEKLAYSLVGYFGLLAKIDSRHRFGNSPVRLIDSEIKTLDDSKGKN